MEDLQVTERHLITLLDGREFESCSEEEAKVAEAWFFVYGTYYRLKKKEPRTFTGVALGLYANQHDTATIVIEGKIPVGTKFVLTEVVE